jgi:hypothetical protein
MKELLQLNINLSLLPRQSNLLKPRLSTFSPYLMNAALLPSQTSWQFSMEPPQVPPSSLRLAKLKNSINLSLIVFSLCSETKMKRHKNSRIASPKILRDSSRVKKLLLLSLALPFHLFQTSAQHQQLLSMLKQLTSSATLLSNRLLAHGLILRLMRHATPTLRQSLIWLIHKLLSVTKPFLILVLN